MGLTRARSYKEVGYLAGIALVSLILAPPCMNIANILLSIDILFWLPFWIYIALLILTGPVLPHLPGFVYGIYTKGWTPRRKKKHLSTSLNYLLAFLISALLSVFMLVLIYAPWVQFVRLFAVYTRFM
jgi:hypothetical protein